jgi:DNA-binding response OmpR family regulator
MDQKKIVLLVEDDLMIRDAYQEALQNAGYLVDIASNGEECLTKIKARKPDLLLLDLFLPKVSGFDIIEKIKADAAIADIPIIVISNVFIDREDLAKKGVNYSFVKSEVNPGIITTKVGEALTKKN